jgi:preprotein translocase SecE subunit
MALGKQRTGVGERLVRPFVRLSLFLQSVWHELQRVVWPSKSETYALSVVVIVAVLVVAGYMGLLDFIMTAITSRVLGLY